MSALETMDGDAVRLWCRLAADALTQTRAAIDNLNVFPVPDADTGTNLQLTLLSAADAAEAVPAGSRHGDVWQAAAHGALLGACGNSGVIVSEVLRGLAEVCAPAARCDGEVVARALAHAAAAARAAVRRPAEGTVLTVADAAALAAGGSPGSLTDVVAAAVAGAREALAMTQGQLDVLAASGVVDAGAAGYCVLLDALAATVTGRVPPVYEVPARVPQDGAPARPAGAASGSAGSAAGYEVTYLLDAAAPAVAGLRTRLDALGDSLVIVGGDDLWNVHVHVADAGAAIEEGLRAGRPRRITVTFLGDARPAGRRVVAVAEGDGLAALLRAAGALTVRYDSGDRPTPPALIAALRQAGAQAIVVPNGPQAAAVATAAVARLGDEGTEVAVIPVSSAVQGLAALAVHDPLREFSTDVAAMTAAATAMRHGWVEFAGPGRALAFAGDELVITGAGPVDAALALAEFLLAGGGELVTLVEGGPAGGAGGGVDGLAGGAARGLAGGAAGGASGPAGGAAGGASGPAGGATDGPAGGAADAASGAASGAAGPAECVPGGLAELVAGRLRETMPDIETVCYGGGPARLPLLIGVE
jgi:DAK2 domain fusion protein YloV